MVKTWVKCVICVVTTLVAATIMPAQDLPVLPTDKAVKTGVLPNGTEYYIVSNPTLEGVADFALVQRVGTDNIPDTASFRAVTVARDALCMLPRTGGASVQEYFTSHGVTPGKEGFVKVTDDATEFRFSNVLLSKPEILDSTLLVLLDMVDRVSTTDDPFLRKWYAPSDQAVMIAGDVDASAVADKLKMMSYMTPAAESSARKEYVWNPVDSAVFVSVPDTLKNLASFTATWNSERAPKEYMNTVQPAIYEFFLAELGLMAEEYVSDELMMLNIPAADVSCSHRTSLQSSGDEAFSVSVSVAEKDFAAAVEAVARVMGRIDAGCAEVRDLMRIKRIIMDRDRNMAFASTMENSDYIDRFVAAFVYNGSLSTLQTKVDFLAERVLSDSTELRLFNSISSALLDPEKNLKVEYTHSMPADSVKAVMGRAWKCAETGLDSADADELGDHPYFVYAGPKVKLKSEREDHISGGVEWTFSNGFKVVYRRMPAGGRMHYALALNGGFGSIKDIGEGEGGYVSDYYMLGKVFGRTADEFIADLASEGMSLDVCTGLNSTMISGSADDEDVGLVMTALLTAMNCWEADPEAVGYYESCEPLRHEMRKGSAAEMIAKVNEIMCPDYKYVSYRMLDRLSPDLAGKAERFYNDIFSKTNDGVLILLGDVEPDVLKKKITQYVGGFRTSDRAFRRPLVRYQPASGWSTYTVEGDRNSVDMALSVPMALTAENYMIAEIAAMVLNKALSEAVIDTGMYLDLSHDCRIYPNERINFHISLSEASPDGFASDVEHSGPIEALAIVRSVLSGVAGTDVSKQDVETFKVHLKGRLKEEMKDPFYWLNVISRRHLSGKDFTTNHEARINAVTVEKVKEMLSEIGNGTRVEYIVSR